MKIKKNDRAYLWDYKIDIQTSKDIYFQELALLFDKPEFINLLPDLRRTYKVASLFPLKDYDDELNMYDREHFMQNTKVKIDVSKYTTAVEMEDSFPEFFDFISIAHVIPEALDAECDLICYKFRRPPYFLDAIKQAIFCGAVNDEFFQPTQARTVDFSVEGAWPTLERVAIFLSPTSTYEDVKEEFRKARELIKTDKRLCYYTPHTDTVPNIRKYRRWYWEQIHGNTLKEIAKAWENEHNSETDEDYTDYTEVQKGIKTYKRLLAS